MTEMWGPFAVSEMDVSKLRGISLSTSIALGTLENYDELEDGEENGLHGFENALETLQEPRHSEGTCINLQGRDTTPLIEYVAEDEEQRQTLVGNYETAMDVAEKLVDDPEQVSEQAYDEAIDAAYEAYNLLNERIDAVDDPYLF